MIKIYLLRSSETAENRESYTVHLIYAIKRGIWHFSKHFGGFYKVRSKSNVKKVTSHFVSKQNLFLTFELSLSPIFSSSVFKMTTLQSLSGASRIPGPHDKVYKDECFFSFDSPVRNLQYFTFLVENAKTFSQNELMIV